jgi:hypothetical protein
MKMTSYINKIKNLIKFRKRIKALFATYLYARVKTKRLVFKNKNNLIDLLELVLRRDTEKTQRLLESDIIAQLQDNNAGFLFDEICDVTSDPATSRLVIARTLMRLNRIESAFLLCEKALEISPQTWNTVFWHKIVISKVMYVTEKIDRLIELLDTPSAIIPKFDELVEERTRNARERGIPPVFYPRLPKSAAGSIGKELVKILGIYGIQTSTGSFPDYSDYLIPAWAEKFSAGGLFTGVHTTANSHNISLINKLGINRVLVNVRDPRQALLSLVHHFDRYFLDKNSPWNDYVYPYLTDSFEDYSLEKKIDWCIENYLPKIITWIEDWIEFAGSNERDTKILFTQYEDFVADKVTFFKRIFDFLDIDDKEFVDNTDSSGIKTHFRLGLTDEWRSVFTKKQAELTWDLIPVESKKLFGWKK